MVISSVTQNKTTEIKPVGVMSQCPSALTILAEIIANLLSLSPRWFTSSENALILTHFSAIYFLIYSDYKHDLFYKFGTLENFTLYY